MIKIDINLLMDKYAQIADMVSFESFLDFNLPEYKSYIEALNRNCADG